MKGSLVKSVFPSVICIVQDTALFIESFLSSCKETYVYSVNKKFRALTSMVCLSVQRKKQRTRNFYCSKLWGRVSTFHMAYETLNNLNDFWYGQ